MVLRCGQRRDCTPAWANGITSVITHAGSAALARNTGVGGPRDDAWVHLWGTLG